MSFWFFMVVVVMITPVVMIVVGSNFIKNPAEAINEDYGYRTEMSMKNQDTWDFANRYCGKVWRFIGWISLPIMPLVMVLVRGQSNNVVGITALVLIGVQILSMNIIVFVVEKKLRATFDANGRRRKS